MSEFPAAQFIVRSRFVPKSGIPTPVPSWKTSEWAADALAENDPARDPKREVL